MTRDRTPGALWFLAGALIAVLAMRFGPTRDTHVETPIIVRASTPVTVTVEQDRGGGGLIGPGLGP